MNKKVSLCYLYLILHQYSDENHPLSRKKINEYLESQYDCVLDRKTIHSHIEVLNEMGCDIQTAKTAYDGYVMVQRLFEPSEVQLLCNAIYAAHFIPEKASKDLIDKIFSTQSRYAKKEFNDTVFMQNRRKSLNKQFFLNVEVLNEAIRSQQAVSFRYMKYNLKKEMIPRKERWYIIHPYYIIYANENYYLICKNDEYENFSHYRIDKMQDMKILDQPRKQLAASFDPYEYAKSKIYMFGGDEDRITLKCSYTMLDDVIDRFGNDVILQKYDDQHFLAVVHSSKQGMIYFCLQYLRHCEVTAPKSLREEVAGILRASLKAYDN